MDMSINFEHLEFDLRFVDAIQLTPIKQDLEGNYIRVLTIRGGDTVLTHILSAEDPEDLKLIEDKKTAVPLTAEDA